MSIVVRLPWPDCRLNPNRKVHWAVRAKLRRDAKAWACYATIAAMNVSGMRVAPADRTVDIAVSYAPPDRRRRDEDNLTASLKAHFDGIAQALRIDDSFFHHKEVSWLPPVRHGAVFVKVSFRKKTRWNR